MPRTQVAVESGRHGGGVVGGSMSLSVLCGGRRGMEATESPTWSCGKGCAGSCGWVCGVGGREGKAGGSGTFGASLLRFDEGSMVRHRSRERRPRSRAAGNVGRRGGSRSSPNPGVEGASAGCRWPRYLSPGGKEKYTEIDTKTKQVGLTTTGEEKHSGRGEAAQRGGMGGRRTCRR